MELDTSTKPDTMEASLITRHPYARHLYPLNHPHPHHSEAMPWTNGAQRRLLGTWRQALGFTMPDIVHPSLRSLALTTLGIYSLGVWPVVLRFTRRSLAHRFGPALGFAARTYALAHSSCAQGGDRLRSVASRSCNQSSLRSLWSLRLRDLGPLSSFFFRRDSA